MVRDGLRLVIISLLAAGLLLAVLPSGSNPVVLLLPITVLYAVGQIMLLIGGVTWLAHGRRRRRDAAVSDTSEDSTAEPPPRV